LAQSHLALANAHLAAEQDAEALSALDEASRCDPANAEILLESATIRWRNLRDAAAALALLDRAIDLQPSLVPALRLRAEVQETIGDREGARRTTGVIRWLAARTGGRP
ncbi:MAG: tetratricopeptide repeat protein, partial [Verrucomicrobiota bacterium]